MEHRKFKTRVKELVDELTAAQAQKLISALRERGNGDEVVELIEPRLGDEPQCPHCGKLHVHRHGHAHGLQRYKCVDCDKTFNALTGTPLARLRKKESWLSYADALKSTMSVRKAAKHAGVHKTTSFRWRHRFWKSQNTSKDKPLSGIAEMDEFFILESRKGERKLPRKARKRGGKAKKPGLSSEQVPVLIARDRQGNMIDAVLPDRSEAAVRNVLKGAISKDDTLLCMDADPAFIAFAEAENIEYELIIASHGEHVHEKVLHIQNVNGYIRRFRQWLDPFNGVATKYLPSYVGWCRWLEQSGASLTAQGCLAAAIA